MPRWLTLLLRMRREDQFANHVRRKSPALQKARSLRLLFSGGGGKAVLPLENGGSALQLSLRGNGSDDLVGHALALQVVADFRGAVLAGHHVGALLGKTVVGEEFPPLQLNQKYFKELLGCSERQKLAVQLGAGVLAPGEVPQRAGFKLRRAFWC